MRLFGLKSAIKRHMGKAPTPQARATGGYIRRLRGGLRNTKLSPKALAEGRARAQAAPPHYGVTLAALAHAARLNPRPRMAGKQYDRIKPYFDVEYYLALYPDVACKEFDPIWHYIRAGAREGRNPSPFFSTKLYVQRYPAAAKYRGTPLDHWVTRGRKEGKSGVPSFDPHIPAVLGLPQDEMLEHLTTRHADLRARLAFGELGRMVTRTARFEPAISKVWPVSMALRVLPFTSPGITNRISSLYRLQESLNWQRARVVLVEDDSAGEDPLFAPLLETAIEAVGLQNVVVLRTSTVPPKTGDKGPKGLRQCWLFEQKQRAAADSNRIVVDLLFSLKPELVIGCSSARLYDTLRSYGTAMQATFRILTTLPPTDQNAFEHYAHGPETALYRLLPHIDGVLCNDEAHRRALVDNNHLPEALWDIVLPHAAFRAAGGVTAYLAHSTADKSGAGGA